MYQGPKSNCTKDDTSWQIRSLFLRC